MLRPCVPSSGGDLHHALTSFQTNVLVDSDGRAHIAGLATAFIPSNMFGEDVDRSVPGTAPELIDARPWGFTDTGATTASDMYAFSVLAWEVRVKSVASPDHSLNGTGSVVRSLLDNLHSPARTSLQWFIQCSTDADRLDLTTLNSLTACGR